MSGGLSPSGPWKAPLVGGKYRARAMAPPVVWKVIGSAVGRAAASSGSEIERASTPAGSPVAGSRRRSTAPSCGPAARTAACQPPTRRPSSSVKGRSTFVTMPSGAMRTSPSAPSARATARTAPSSVNAYVERSKTQAGSPSSASIGARFRAGPSRWSGPSNAYRFHHAVSSDAKWRTPAGDHSGCTIEIPGPPATVRASPSEPSGPIAATRRRVASQGMSG
jgi:hypothetical protein